MTNRRSDPVALAAAKAGFSPATGYRILQDARLPSQRQTPRSRRRPDPMIDAQRLSLMLNELRLPTIKHIWTPLRTGRIWRDRVAAAITGAMDRAARLFSG